MLTVYGPVSKEGSGAEHVYTLNIYENDENSETTGS